MYSKKFDSISNVGPAFEDLTAEEMGIVDGGATVATAVEATVGFCAWTNVSCLVSATVASCVVTGAYIYKTKWR